MTPKQILDSFSQTLMQDERILSGPERALLAAIMQHANDASGGNRLTQESVRAVIASAVGEIVAQRAFAVLGTSIVERILQEGTSLPLVDGRRVVSELLATPKDPKPPSPGPQPPAQAPLAPSPGPKSTTFAPRTPSPGPQPPAHAPLAPSPGPQPPGAITTGVLSQSGVGLAERTESLPARCVVLDEFLAPQELEELMRFTLEHKADFEASEVVSPHSEGGVVNYEHRSSRVLMNVGKHQELLLERIKGVLPEVLAELGMKEFTIAGVEAQITASNDGDFFLFHSDNGSEAVASRHLTFVYFFHREPAAFEGGELRMHDARRQDGAYVSDGKYQSIRPQQNQIVFFPCELLHEITPVKCGSQLFADSRFTLNGWLRQ